MKTHPAPSSPDDRLDALLRRRPLRPSPDFADRTLERLRRESAADPAPASRLLPFPAWAGLAAAASLAFAVGLFTLARPSRVPVPTPGVPTPGAVLAPEAYSAIDVVALDADFESLEFLLEEDTLEILALLSSSVSS